MVSSDGVHQLVHYDDGIGSDGHPIDKIAGGLFGVGIDQKIMDLYAFLVMNYEDGDEVYLFGFSRGAYTVRSLGGLINHSGLVRRDRLELIKKAYELYRKHDDPNCVEAQSFRSQHGRQIPIVLIACFDTVGDLGIPTGPIQQDLQKYQFHNTKLAESVQNGIHVLSIDENRKAFTPTMMDSSDPARPDQVTQLYFPGGHSGVGGGSAAEVPLSDNTMNFVIEEMKRRGLGLEFDPSKIPLGHVNVPPPMHDAKWLILHAIGGTHVRPIRSLEDCHVRSVSLRLQLQPRWRPPALRHLENNFLRIDTSSFFA